MNRCLYCYKLLLENEIDFHIPCSKKFFGSSNPPSIEFDENSMDEYALKLIQSSTNVTGVQKKISLQIESEKDHPRKKRFTITGLIGGYILKTPSPNYKHLPEVEDLTMHLASIAKINVVPHTLIRLQSGNLAYLTKRIDRNNIEKIHMEDMCQLSERLSEHKYLGSYEQIAKTIIKYSANPGLDLINFWEIVLFSFTTGNADMHLKNFSLISKSKVGPVLAPAYDLVATILVNPDDDEELALTLNSKKKKIKREDFVSAFTTSKLTLKQQENIFNKMILKKNDWLSFIKLSFINDEMKEKYSELISQRIQRIN